MYPDGDGSLGYRGRHWAIPAPSEGRCEWGFERRFLIVGGSDGSPVVIFIKGHPYLLGIRTEMFRDYMVSPDSL